MSFFSELRERRMVQFVVAYAAAGWLVVLEGAATLVEMEIVPNIVYRVLLIWYVGGFLITLVLGWYHGEKGRQTVSLTEVGFLGTIGLAVLAVTGSTIAGEVGGKEIAEGELPFRNVAVLYFEDFSRDSTNAYLADAFTEGLIEELGTVGTLNVVSSSGVRRFRGSDVPYDSIASVLGTGLIVDGSVEVSGERARINVQVVDGASGAQISRLRPVQRPLREARAAVGELAQDVALQLREILGEELHLQQTAEGTEDFRAWQFFHRAETAVKEGEARIDAGEPHPADVAYRRADSLLAEAEAVDPEWPDPSVERGRIALVLSQRVRDPDERHALAERGLEHVERALELAPGHARALELRGTLRYWRWLARLTRTPGEREALFAQAQDDLERATQLNPDLATAWRTLGHLYGNFDNVRSAMAVAQAYEADAYLRDADGILYQLFLTNFSALGQFSQARRWCDEGARRFADDYRFTVCRLQLMTIPGARPDGEDLAEADRLLSVLETRVPESRREERLVQARMLLGAILARASQATPDPARRELLADSARSVLEEAHQRFVTGDLSPALLSPEAYAWLILDEADRAIDLLKIYAAVEHGFRAGGDINWKWMELRSHPRFDELVTRQADGPR